MEGGLPAARGSSAETLTYLVFHHGVGWFGFTCLEKGCTLRWTEFEGDFTGKGA